MKIEIKNISKSFGELKANSEIKISINEGIHALLGENGAGKSTLVKIISGQITPDSGEIVIDNSKLILGSPKESINCLLYTSPSPRDGLLSRMPSSA